MGQLLPPGLGLPWYRPTSSPSSGAGPGSLDDNAQRCLSTSVVTLFKSVSS